LYIASLLRTLSLCPCVGFKSQATPPYRIILLSIRDFSSSNNSVIPKLSLASYLSSLVPNSDKKFDYYK